MDGRRHKAYPPDAERQPRVAAFGDRSCHCCFRGGERTSEDARGAAATVGSASGRKTGLSNGEAAANDRVDEGGVDPPWRETGAGASPDVSMAVSWQPVGIAHKKNAHRDSTTQTHSK